MALPPMQIYAFEDELERAVNSVLLANGVNDPSKQRDWKVDIDGTPMALKTPRVQVQFINGGFANREHYYVNSSGRWLDFADGIMYLKIVTRREDGEVSHAALRGLCRYVMQQVSAISAAMKYHLIEKMIETQTAISFDNDRLHDVSALSYQTTLRIRPEWFPVS